MDLLLLLYSQYAKLNKKAFKHQFLKVLGFGRRTVTKSIKLIKLNALFFENFFWSISKFMIHSR